MSQTRVFVTLLAGVLCPCGWSQQASEGPGSIVLLSLNAKELDAVMTSRKAAYEELAEKAAAFVTAYAEVTAPKGNLATTRAADNTPGCLQNKT